MSLFTGILLSICLLFSFIYFLILTKYSFLKKEYFPATFYASLGVLTGVAIVLSTKNYLKETLPLWAMAIVVIILLLLFKQSLGTLNSYIKEIEKQIINAKSDVSISQKRIIQLEKRLADIINNLEKEE